MLAVPRLFDLPRRMGQPMPDIRLIHGDCLSVLPTLESGSVDAVVTDPPYGIRHPCNFRQRGRGKLAKYNDYSDVIGDDKPFDPQPFLILDVPTVLWGGNHFANRLPASTGWLVWDKCRPDDLDQSTCELAWTNTVKGVRRFRHLWNGMMRASEHGECYHPTQKPVALMLWCLRMLDLPTGATVFDPYMGSGPVAIAANQMGLSYIGIERDATYFAIAQRRIAAEVSRGNLFAGAT